MLRTVVLWLTFHCNYQCPYCITRKRVNEIPYTRLAKDWLWAFSRYQNLLIDITGGEPMIYAELPELVEGLLKQGHRVAITTNISMNRLPDEIWKLLYSVTLSYHPTQTTIEQFLPEATRIKQLNPHTSVNFVAARQQYDQIPTLSRSFAEVGIRFHVDPQAELQYTQTEIDFLRPYLEPDRDWEAKYKILNQPRLCSAGVTYTQILPNGMLIPCFRFSHSTGSFFDELPPLFTEPISCVTEWCGGCDWDAVEIRDLEGNLIKGGKQ